MNKGKIFVISGPSGAGKGTLINLLRNLSDLKLVWAKSYTTRPKRSSDDEENKYIFVDTNEFKNKESSGEIIESNLYNNNWYGSSKNDIESSIDNGFNVIKDIDVNGGMYYKKNFPNAVLIFIKSDLKDIKQRLIDRGQNTDDEIFDRLETAKREMDFEDDYKYSVENPEGHPEKAVEEIIRIIKNECSKDNQRT